MPSAKNKKTAPETTKEKSKGAKNEGAKRKGGDASGAEAVQRAAAEAIAAIAKLEALLPPLVNLSPDERAVSLGRLRDGEAKVIGSILDAVDAHPQHFSALADRDKGTDEGVVETGPTRDALAKALALVPVAERLTTLATALSDTVLTHFASAREFSIGAYSLGRPAAKFDAKLRSTLNEAHTFYQSPARLVRARAAKGAKTPPSK